jgi:hypothetical protein
MRGKARQPHAAVLASSLFCKKYLDPDRPGYRDQYSSLGSALRHGRKGLALIFFGLGQVGLTGVDCPAMPGYSNWQECCVGVWTGLILFVSVRSISLSIIEYLEKVKTFASISNKRLWTEDRLNKEDGQIMVFVLCAVESP